MRRMAPIPAGALLTVTTGEYSDYQVQGVFRALQRIDAEALLEEWCSAHPKQREAYEFDDVAFLAFVARKGLLEPVYSFEWHLCNYRSASDMNVMECLAKDIQEARPQ